MMTACRRTTLAVLAGGEGRRMGMAKGEISFAGRPILDRLLSRLNWPGPTLLVTAPGREHPPGWRRFTAETADPVRGEGPLRGILTALDHAPTNEVVVLPVDMPNVTREPIAWIASRLRDHSAAAGLMVARLGRDTSRLEPLPAAFRADIARDLIRARVRDREFALHGLAQSEQFVVVPAPPEWPKDFWTNLNTQSDLAAYQKS